jgi:hypothetical protein
MTKVIFARTDEWCGCKNAHPEVSEGLADGKLDRRAKARWKASEKELVPWPSEF